MEVLTGSVTIVESKRYRYSILIDVPDYSVTRE